MSKYNIGTVRGIVSRKDKNNSKHKMIKVSGNEFPSRKGEYEFPLGKGEYEKEDMVIHDKEKILDFYLYEDAIDKLSAKNGFNCDNVNLLINKFSNKNTLAKNLKDKYSKIINNTEIYEYIDEQANLLEKTNLYKVEKYEFSVMNRMVVGYGGTTTYNNDITLHHVYGVPYIPGQAIKGVLKHYISNYSDDNNEKALLDYLGDEDNKGDIVFFDSYPKKDCNIVMDVMSVHHTDYYTKEDSFPRDDESPRVIKFLAVEGGFVVRLGICKELIKKSSIELETLKKALMNALHQVGIGGKTSVGYGALEFQEDKSQQENIKPKEISSTETSNNDDYIDESFLNDSVANLIKHFNNI